MTGRGAFGPLADVRRGQQLADGVHLDTINRRRRQLRSRRELAQRIDLVAPELRANRPAPRPREHVDGPAANRELAAVFDDVRARVAQRDQPFGQGVGRDLVTLGDDERLVGPEARRDPLDGRQHGRHDDERPRRLPHRPSRRGPPRRDLRRRTDSLVRQRLPGWEERDPFGAQIGRHSPG
jgi:hypothetical protein